MNPRGRWIVWGAVLMSARSGPARADAGARVQYQTRVNAGETPWVKVIADESLASVTIDLMREDGRPFRTTCAPLGQGKTCILSLGGEPGTRVYRGHLRLGVAGREQESPLSLTAVVAAALTLTIDRARVDLAARRLVIVASRPPASVELKVHGPDGGEPLVHTVDVKGRGAGDAVAVSWPPGRDKPARIEVKVNDVEGFFTGASLVPWNVSIPHEEVTFASGKADIAVTERPKLDASLVRIAAALTVHRDLPPIRLFIAGHTDTVGDDASNLQLSLDRARAIANYFRGRGLGLAIAFEGFGERALRVATGDEVDEARNRRADYILSVEEPLANATPAPPLALAQVARGCGITSALS